MLSDSKPLKRDQRAASGREDLRHSVCVPERGQERPLPMTLEIQNKRQTIIAGTSNKIINRSQTAQPKKGILKKSSSSSNIKLPRKQPVSFKGLRGKEGSSGKKARERDALINSQKMLNGGSLKFYNDEIQRLSQQRTNFEGS